MPENLLPQSALPIGQTPLATIQSPKVAVSIPNPIDVTNFFRMQQGLQRNVGILQQNEALKMRKRALDLNEYELMIKETDAILGMVNGAFGDFYQGKAQNRAANQSTSQSLFGDLDPTLGRHEQAIRRNQDVLGKAEEEAFNIGKNLLGSGSRDPESRFEAVRNIRNTLGDATRQIQADKEFVELSKMNRAYNQWLDKLSAAESQGFNIDGAAVDAMEARYREWADTGKGSVGLSDFRIGDYVYKGSDVLTKIAADAETIGKQTFDRFTEIETEDGSILRGTETTRKGIDQVTNDLYNKYINDPGAISLYNNTIKGKVDSNGDPITFRKWIQMQAAPYAVLEGFETTETDRGSAPLVKPGDKTTTGGSQSGFRSSLGRDPETEKERRFERIEKDIWGVGFDNTDAGAIAIDEIGEVLRIRGTGGVEFRAVDKNGKAVPKGDPEAVRLEVYETGNIDEEGEPTPERLIATFGRRDDITKNVGGGETPSGLIPITQDSVKELGIDMGIKGENHALSSTAVDTLKAIPAEFKTTSPRTGEPELIITSTYRDEHANEKVDGAEHSHHKTGDGIDIRTKNDAGKRFAEWATATSEGQQWLDDQGYKAIWEDKGEDNEHLHLEPRESKVVVSDTSMDMTETEEVESIGDVKADRIKLKPDKLRENTLDRIIANDDTVSFEEIEDMLDNPPKGKEPLMRKIKRDMERQPIVQKEINKLEAKARRTDLTDKEERKLEKLQDELKTLDNATDFEGIRDMVMGNVSGEIEPAIMNDFIDTEVGVLEPGQQRDFFFDTEKNPVRENRAIVMGARITRDEEDPSLYVVEKARKGVGTGFSSVNRALDGTVVEVMDKDELTEWLKKHSDKFDEQTVNSVLSEDAIENRMVEDAERRMLERQIALDQEQAIADTAVRQQAEAKQRRQRKSRETQQPIGVPDYLKN